VVGVVHGRQLPLVDDAGVEAAHDADHVVGRPLDVLQAGVQRLHVAAGHALEAAITEHGQDVIGQVLAVVDRGAGLQIDVHVLADEAIGELANCHSL
jgi:hypothetical protein